MAGSSKDSIVNRISLANFQSSTKIEALREELENMMQRDPSGKAIVFSQFTSMLDLIAFRLQQVRSLSCKTPCQSPLANGWLQCQPEGFTSFPQAVLAIPAEDTSAYRY